MDKKKAFGNWTSAYVRAVKQDRALSWPNETLIRMVKGDYIPGLKKDYKGKKVLDVGCGLGTNLTLFGSLDMKLYGTEVEGGITKQAGAMLREAGYEADIRVGQNRKLPFDSGTFDYMVSWNVLHYEPTESRICKAISEYARVLRKGGRIFLSTTGPTHLILEGARALGNHRYEIGSAGGFRKGEVYFYFDTPDYVRYYFSENFRDIMVGRVDDTLFTKKQDYFIMTALRK